MTIELCRTPGCTETVTHRSKSGLCKKCHSSLYYWNQHKDRVSLRTQQLKFWQGRLTFFVNKIIGKR